MTSPTLSLPARLPLLLTPLTSLPPLLLLPSPSLFLVIAGPYGDPNRYDPAPRPQDGVSLAVAGKGIYERSISLFRTSYSTVTQSRGSLPAFVGARVWICQYMPAMSTYTPLYVSAPALPKSYTIGSLFKVGRPTPTYRSYLPTYRLTPASHLTHLPACYLHLPH